MPGLDGTRTDLAYETADGSRALRFEHLALVAFDVYRLRRPDTTQDYSPAEPARAETRLAQMSHAERELLQHNIIAGLPGSEESFTLAASQLALDAYDGIDPAQLRQHLILFLEAIVPVAEEVGVNLTIQPDDPPFAILDLPRVVSPQADVQALVDAVPSGRNDLCFCSGSFSVRPDNSLMHLLRVIADRIHSVHLRSTQRDGEGNFYEANNLEGDVDTFSVVSGLVAIMD